MRVTIFYLEGKERNSIKYLASYRDGGIYSSLNYVIVAMAQLLCRGLRKIPRDGGEVRNKKL